MADPQFFDINSSQFQEITPTGNEEIQVGATQKVKLSAIANLLDLSSKTLSGINIPTNVTQSLPVSSTDNIISAIQKILSFTSNGNYITLLGQNIGSDNIAKVFCIYTFNASVGVSSFNSICIGIPSSSGIWWGVKSGGIDPRNYNTDKALLDAIWNASTKDHISQDNFQTVPGHTTYTLTSDNVSVALEIYGNHDYVINKSSSVTISSNKTFTLKVANFGTGKESTLIYIPTSIVSAAKDITFTPGSGTVLYAGPGFTKSGNNVVTSLDPSLGSVLVIAIQYTPGIGLVLNSAYYA